MNLPKEFLDNAYLLAEAGRNVPKKNPEFHIFFGDTIPKQYQNDIKKLMDILIDVFGGYDRWVHAVYDYDVKATNKTLVSGLEKLGYFKYNFDSGVTPSFARVVERASCLSGFSAGPRGPIDYYPFCNVPYAVTNPSQAFGLQLYGEKGMRYRAVTNFMIHEYHHHVQIAHELGKEGSWGNGPGAPFPPDGFAPRWWVEGTADVTPTWIIRDYCNEFEITKEFGFTYDEIIAAKNFDGSLNEELRKLRQVVFGQCCGWLDDVFLNEVKAMQSGKKCEKVDNRQEWEYGGSQNPGKYYGYIHNPKGDANAPDCNWDLMASYLMHITSPQIALVSILENQWRLGWQGSFKKHVGMSMDEFYIKYEKFLKSFDARPWADVNSDSLGYTVRGGKPLPKWIYIPKTKFKDTVDFWSIKSGPLN